ncbi:uncharacterized protein LOC113206979 isoform X1 [Frankliniella occidentalis]|uniref:Uncharacterized protein LOC113206979 isoform X1 n=1 Tax=Frankliniella occidentalis TaxID=133901 RepID=A0A6J1SIB6_FRAOC|nr:uncharacterized protein LOC113206979 isoform X1 [Frankliniella occidentalis]
MDRLPDDALLEVLLWLPPEDLLACRLVCKRLGTLAMHPHVWRRKCCSVSAASCACPVLRLAPCLGLLQVTLPLKNCLHLYTTRCAVSRLDLLVDKYMKDAALIIHRQSFLLRLKSVTVTLGQYRVGQYLTFDAGVAILFTTLASTCGLTYLKVRAEFGSGLSFDMTQSLQSIAVPSSIKTFIFEGIVQREATHFCSFVLARHAATLETLRILCFLSASTTSLLSDLPNLRRLTYAINPGQEAVTSCKLLRILTLSFCSDDRSVKELFCKAEQLRKVILICHFRPTTVDDVLPETILALSSTRVEKLCIYMSVAVGHALSQTYIVRRAALWALALLSVLPRLPALQELSLDWHTDELLRGINPTTAPALRILSLHCGAVRPCTPGPAHRDAFKSLFSANPSVKVKVTRSCTRCL